MASDAILRSSLVCLGAIVLLIGIYTYSFKKMIATYAFGILAIAGILLPDWEFFNRDYSQWTKPVSFNSFSEQGTRSRRFRIYPIRLTIYATIYGFGLYKWWMFVFNS